MAITQTETQVYALKELLRARQAFHNAFNEFTRTLPTKVQDDRVAHMVEHLPNIDPKETDEKTLKQVLVLAYGAFTFSKAEASKPRMRVSTLLDIYEFVVKECRNGCTDARGAFIYISQVHPEWVDKDGPTKGYALGQFLGTLNFSAIRENSRDLIKLTFD